MTTATDATHCIQCGRKFFNDRPTAKYAKCKKCRPVRRCRTMRENLERQRSQRDAAVVAVKMPEMAPEKPPKPARPVYICNRCHGMTFQELTECGDEFVCRRCAKAKPDLTVEEVYRLAAEIRAQRDETWEMD